MKNSLYKINLVRKYSRPRGLVTYNASLDYKKMHTKVCLLTNLFFCWGCGHEDMHQAAAPKKESVFKQVYIIIKKAYDKDTWQTAIKDVLACVPKTPDWEAIRDACKI